MWCVECSDSSSARVSYEPCCGDLARVIPQTRVMYIIRSIYIHNTAQRDEHDYPSIQTCPWSGGKKQLKKFGGGKAVNQAKRFERLSDACWALFAPVLDYGMDALKSAGRAIIRSPSIAKQSWGVGRHKSKYWAWAFPHIHTENVLAA